MHWISPLARAGFSMLAASIEPAAEPEPTMVCNSSMNSIMSLCDFSSSVSDLILSSNCPLYLVPATSAARSSDMILLPCNTGDTVCSAILRASPSTMADLPTPGSPMRTGLFFFLRHNICATLCISFSLPTSGSSFPSAAALVRSVQYLSTVGVEALSGLAVLVVLSSSAKFSSSSNMLSSRSMPDDTECWPCSA